MRRVYRRPKPKEQGKPFRVNLQIRVPQVFLIDESGASIGIMDLGKALVKAQEVGMDLVEVNPKANPPVVKIIDFGQFKYKKEKEAQRQKVSQRKIEIKGIRLSVRISQHDFEIRLDQARKFLAKGDKLKVELGLKGRERQHPEKAYEIISRFIQELKNTPDFHIETEQDLTKQDGRYNIILINKQ